MSKESSRFGHLPSFIKPYEDNDPDLQEPRKISYHTMMGRRTLMFLGAYSIAKIVIPHKVAEPQTHTEQQFANNYGNPDLIVNIGIRATLEELIFRLPARNIAETLARKVGFATAYNSVGVTQSIIFGFAHREKNLASKLLISNLGWIWFKLNGRSDLPLNSSIAHFISNLLVSRQMNKQLKSKY